MAFPTFVIFVNGEVTDKWTGANQIKLQEKLNKLRDQLKNEKK